MRCCPMAESLFILELGFLHIRGGCSVIIVCFVLTFMGTCCFILSVTLPTYQVSMHPTYQSCVNKKSSFSHLDSSSKQW